MTCKFLGAVDTMQTSKIFNESYWILRAKNVNKIIGHVEHVAVALTSSSNMEISTHISSVLELHAEVFAASLVRSSV
jgi:hypothetical protein